MFALRGGWKILPIIKNNKEKMTAQLRKRGIDVASLSLKDGVENMDAKAKSSRSPRRSPKKNSSGGGKSNIFFG